MDISIETAHCPSDQPALPPYVAHAPLTFGQEWILVVMCCRRRYEPHSSPIIFIDNFPGFTPWVNFPRFQCLGSANGCFLVVTSRVMSFVIDGDVEEVVERDSMCAHSYRYAIAHIKVLYHCG